VRRLFRRRDEPPADVVALLPRDERVVSWADVAGGGVVLASPAGLWWPGHAEPRLIGWQHISKAIWRDGALSVIEADIVDDLLIIDHDPVSVALGVPRDLPPVVHKRVTANVVRSVVVPVAGGTARLVARRIPGQNGVHCWARLEAGAQDTAAMRTVLADQLDRLRAELAPA
jgi:hypothetical protein